MEVGTAAVRQTLSMGHTHICTQETGQSSCSHGAGGVRYCRTAWEPGWSSIALLSSVLGHLFCTQVCNVVSRVPDDQIKNIYLYNFL